MTELQPNTYLGQYLLLDVVGRGGSGVVYRAFQPSLNRYVAVKVLLRGLDPHYVSRFEREVQAIAQLQHRNILPIYDFGQQDSWRYFVMQYVEGGSSLGDRIAAGPLEPLAAMKLICHLLDALGYAHQQGVIHRDIKPSNILLPSPEWPLLADFGIAKLTNAPQLTPPGTAIGTAAYIAPEAGLQRPIDGRADLYSTGVVLYEMLTGEVPFQAPTPVAVMAKHISEPPPPLRDRRPELHPVVEAVVLRALAKEPADRYQSAAEMQAAIGAAIRQVEWARAQAWLLGQLSTSGTATARSARSGYTTRQLAARPPAPRPLRPAPSQPGARRRSPLLAALAALLLLLIIGALSWSLRRESLAQAPQPAATAAPAEPAPPADAPPATPVAAPAEPPPAAPTELPPAPTEPPPAPTEPPPAPTEPPPAPTEPPPAPSEVVIPVAAPPGATTLLLEEQLWTGGYGLSRGSNRYGGRTATWIYGQRSEYSTMRVSFELADQPAGTAQLRVEGMDSEGPAKTPISIAVNGAEIYRGPNRLPDDDFALETGTWASATWPFDAALLRPGLNEITISNLDEGGFGGPPFFMLDYAELTLEPA